MSRKKVLLIGSGILMATAGMAANTPMIENVDLGNSFDHKRQSFEANEIQVTNDIFTPSELNCAYGGGNFSQQRPPLQTKAQKRKYRRKAKRAQRKK
ncbi:MAG: hypothetical protein MK066_00200 [Crocinitomicaceae bacterium]|nr:hypothetical protein [Crocinitomicaceae bacterium]